MANLNEAVAHLEAIENEHRELQDERATITARINEINRRIEDLDSASWSAHRAVVAAAIETVH